MIVVQSWMQIGIISVHVPSSVGVIVISLPNLFPLHLNPNPQHLNRKLMHLPIQLLILLLTLQPHEFSIHVLNLRLHQVTIVISKKTLLAIRICLDVVQNVEVLLALGDVEGASFFEKVSVFEWNSSTLSSIIFIRRSLLLEGEGPEGLGTERVAVPLIEKPVVGAAIGSALEALKEFVGVASETWIMGTCCWP
jgi:hypothetical protein